MKEKEKRAPGLNPQQRCCLIFVIFGQNKQNFIFYISFPIQFILFKSVLVENY